MVARPLEFLSTFLLRAPPLEMRREGRESFPDETGKGTLISSGGGGKGHCIPMSNHVLKFWMEKWKT